MGQSRYDTSVKTLGFLQERCRTHIILCVKHSWILFLLALALIGACGKVKPAVAKGDGHTHIDAPPLDVSLAKAKELGMPTTAEELTASRPDRTDQAGKAYAALRSLEDSEPALLLERFLKGQATDAEADAAIGKLHKEFVAMEAVAAMETFAPVRDFSKGMELEFTEYEPMQRVCIALLARGVRKAAKGDTTGAKADFERAGTVVRHASQEDLLLSEFLTTMCIDHWWKAAVHATKANAKMGPVLAELAAALPAVEARKGVGTDLALIRTTIDRIRKKEVTYSKVAGLESAALVDGKNMDEMLLAGIDEAEKIAAAYAVAIYEAWPKRQAVLQMVHDAQHQASGEEAAKTVMHAFESLAMTFSLPLKNSEALAQAEIECFRIAVAAKTLKSQSGSWPKLPDAAKAAGCGEIDPFSGNPYVLKGDGNTVTVYSVGLDGNDDKGKPYKPGEMKGTDVSVTL